jgi:oxygen-independent coproporphyrinogen-3 oxidase
MQVVEAIMDKVNREFGLESGAEVTLEMNPESDHVDRDRIRMWRGLGINRFSVGVQSFSDEELRFLGRSHSAREAEAVLGWLDDDGVAHSRSRYSLDLMLGLPGQTPESVAQAVRKALSFHPDHLSIYSLTVERGTPFHQDHPLHQAAVSLEAKRRLPRGLWPPDKDEDFVADLSDAVFDELCGRSGWHRYEVSSYASADVARAHHNSAYWEMEDFAGIGPGAHGRLTVNDQRFATVQIPDPASWLRHAACHPPASSQSSSPDPLLGFSSANAVFRPLPWKEQLDEFVVTSLRTVRGIRIPVLLQLLHRRPLDPAPGRAGASPVMDPLSIVKVLLSSLGRSELSPILAVSSDQQWLSYVSSKHLDLADAVAVAFSDMLDRALQNAGLAVPEG